MAANSANLSVLVGRNFVCVKIAGRANFAFSPDFKTLLNELAEKGYRHFIIDLSECVLMDSTFLGVLAGFGMKLNPKGAPAERGIELLNANTRVARTARKPGRAAPLQDDLRRAATAGRRESLHAGTRQSHARANHAHQPGGASDAHGDESGQRRAVQGRDAVSGRGFEEPRKIFGIAGRTIHRLMAGRLETRRIFNSVLKA